MALAMVEQDHGRALADASPRAWCCTCAAPAFSRSSATRRWRRPTAPTRWARRSPGRAATSAEADVETLARHAGLSVRTLHRRCLETLKTTPGKLVDKLRVEHARTLLSSSALPAKTLAQQCGFGNAVRMRRAFERELGLGPREYRALHAAR